MNLIAYIPVIHRGYLDWFAKHMHSRLFVLGSQLIEELRDGHVEIRAIDPEVIVVMIRALGVFESVEVLTPDNASVLKSVPVLLPDEQISRRFAARYLSLQQATFQPIFLRWDSASVNSQHLAYYDSVSSRAEHQELMKQAFALAENSADWWRQIGGVLVRDGQVLYGDCNNHVPSPELPYAEGDPRDFIPAGTNSEVATTLHVEQALITKAAREGNSLQGTQLFVTVFPCPMCAKLIAYSGITRVFFATGHASLDGDRILKECGVKVTKVEMS